MRLAALALSAAVLGGCSYSPAGGGNLFSGLFSGSSSGHYNASAPEARCRVPYAQAPIPAGCHPSQVTVGPPLGATQGASYVRAGGFPQQPQFGDPAPFRQSKPQYTTGNYGTHASGNSHTALHRGGSKPVLRRPRFRGALDLGIEQSISGNLVDPAIASSDPFAGYDPYLFEEVETEGTPADGQVNIYRYYADSRLQNTVDPWDDEDVPAISFSDAWSTPATIGVSGEFILNDKATVFARGGYTRAEGTNGGGASLEATVFRETTTILYDDNELAPGFVEVGRSVGTDFISENMITEVSYDFSDLERYDLEAGGRFYLDPISGRKTGRTVTPFVGASAGASHYNAASYTLDQRQLSYSSVYDTVTDASGNTSPAGLQYYDLDDNPALGLRGQRVELYDAQWVPSGRLSAGVEWQVTPKTALAFETGVRFEGARDYSNGETGDSNISVPLTLRGSFNF